MAELGFSFSSGKANWGRWTREVLFFPSSSGEEEKVNLPRSLGVCLGVSGHLPFVMSQRASGPFSR